MRGQGRQRQNEAKAFGGLQTERAKNETANQELLDERNTWARGQEGSLGRFLQGAQQQFDLAGQKNGVLDSVLANIASATNSLSGLNSGAAGLTASPYGVSFSDITGGLNASLPQVNTVAEAPSNVNLGLENMSYLERLKRGLL
jgi:hypothetical protein